MKSNEIKELLEMFKEYELTGLELETEDFYINLKNEINITPAGIAMPNISSQVEKPAMEEKQVVEDNCTYIKSPLVGTFYSASSPEAEPFVKVGDRVKKGDVLCIVEAMKVMNEISATMSGTIKEILVENESGVSFEQALFTIE